MFVEIEKVIFEEEKGSVDLLGFQTEFERIFTNKIIPGITVLTWDVRYYGFICWALFKDIDPISADFTQREQELASRLAAHYRNNKTDPFLGSRKAMLPNSQQPYYKITVWSQYKSSMVQLGLIRKDITANCGYALTNKGKSLAGLFKKANYGEKRGFRDEGISKVSKFFWDILFSEDNSDPRILEASKIRKKFKGDLLGACKGKAIKSDQFYKRLELSKIPRLRNAAVTAQLIQKLTNAFLIFYDNVKEKPKKALTIEGGLKENYEIKKALDEGRRYYKKWTDIDDEYKLPDLNKLNNAQDAAMLERIINRHLEVKKDNSLFKQREGTYSTTDIIRPESSGIFGLRKNALVLLLESLKRMDKGLS